MYFYEVIPATNAYHADKSLTYSSPNKLSRGQLVKIKLNRKVYPGIIDKSTIAPDFKTSEIGSAYERKLTDTQLTFLKTIHSYYPSPIGVIAQLFAANHILKPLTDPAKPTNSAIDLDSLSSQPLTTDQTKVYNAIAQLNTPETFLLRGITGSGKTRVYLELAKDAVKAGKSVMILTPEIALTAPLAEQFTQIFGDLVLTNHSNLTPKQKLHLVDQAKNLQSCVLVGPRSTLFIAQNNLNLIIVDEGHDGSYKQESAPFYHANRVASMLANITQSKLILASATPSVNDYFLAEQKNKPILELNRLAINKITDKLKITTVDLTQQTEQTKYPLISATLVKKLTENLENKQQSMLFINKRGTARAIVCQDCGWVLECSNCDLPMVYHHDSHKAICHICGQQVRSPTSCKKCSSLNIHFKSPGTKAIVENLSRLFPKATIARYDKDNVKSERIETNYKDLKSGQIDIIVGTQMISKGFDLVKLTLVVMLITENSLTFPDYTTGERTFQLMTQLAGRVNRGHLPGEFLMQTYKPDNKIISSDLTNWPMFYERELSSRKLLQFPPFSYALKIEVGLKNSKTAENKLNKLSSGLSVSYPKLRLLGPAPSFIQKKNNLYQWQLIVLSKSRSDLLSIARGIPSSYRVDIDPQHFL